MNLQIVSLFSLSHRFFSSLTVLEALCFRFKKLYLAPYKYCSVVKSVEGFEIYPQCSRSHCRFRIVIDNADTVSVRILNDNTNTRTGCPNSHRPCLKSIVNCNQMKFVVTILPLFISIFEK